MNRHAATIFVPRLVGGVPNHPNTIRGWAQTALGPKKANWSEKEIERVIARVSELRPALSEDSKSRENINGFLRHPETGQLCLEGRALGAAIRAAYASATDMRTTGRGKAAPPEIRIPDELVPLWQGERAVMSASVRERVSHSPMTGSSIAREEFVENAVLHFEVESVDIDEEIWPDVWVLAEGKGIGSCRSLSEGAFVVTRWAAESLAR